MARCLKTIATTWRPTMTTERDLFMEAAIALAKEKGHLTITDLFVLKEAVASTLLEHPEWEADDETV
jgi:hypothetical protein